MVTVGFEIITNERDLLIPGVFKINNNIDWSNVIVNDGPRIGKRSFTCLFQRKFNDNAVFVFTSNDMADYIMTTNQPIGETV